jgi:hypothetical protein
MTTLDAFCTVKLSVSLSIPRTIGHERTVREFAVIKGADPSVQSPRRRAAARLHLRSMAQISAAPQ